MLFPVQDSTSFTGYEEDDPQGKGSPIGFLGLGNLDINGFPGSIGETVVDKVCKAACLPVIIQTAANATCRQ